MKERESFGSQLGFILISAGCAIGLGNVWRFPYIVGKYGGAAFLLIYLVFLVILGLPIMAMEFAVGRGSRQSIIRSFSALEPKGSQWHLFSGVGVVGNYLLMMFYTTISGWMLAYLAKMALGDFTGEKAVAVETQFGQMTSHVGLQLFCMGLIVLIGFGICSLGLKNGVERITKIMMSALLIIMVVLTVRAVTLPGAEKGLEYYLIPDFQKVLDNGVGEVLFAALGQSFFTLSIGMGCMAIFGSYIGRERRLLGQALSITVLDTLVAFMAGLIIMPACFAYHVDPQAGPSLIFITLPQIFNTMPGGRLWGTLFFLFMLFAALSTVVAVFENILSFGMDGLGWSRRKSCVINIVLVFALSLPCLFGFNILSGVQPFGEGSTILDLEDFIVSKNILPLGSLIYVIFCCSKKGWGWANFQDEANAGDGLRYPGWLRPYMTYIVPVIILVIWVIGYLQQFTGMF